MLRNVTSEAARSDSPPAVTVHLRIKHTSLCLCPCGDIMNAHDPKTLRIHSVRSASRALHAPLTAHSPVWTHDEQKQTDSRAASGRLAGGDVSEFLKVSVSGRCSVRVELTVAASRGFRTRFRWC